MSPPAMRKRETISLFHVVNSLVSSLKRKHLEKLLALTFYRSAVWEPWRNVLC